MVFEPVYLVWVFVTNTMDEEDFKTTLYILLENELLDRKPWSLNLKSILTALQVYPTFALFKHDVEGSER